MQPTNLRPTSPPTPLLGFCTQGHYSLALITPMTGTRKLGVTAIPLNPLKLFKPILNLLTLPCQFLPTETTIKAPAHVFITLLHPDLLWCFPVWPCVIWHAPLLLGTVTNYLQNANHLLICWLHHTWKIIKYVLKHSHLFKEELNFMACERWCCFHIWQNNRLFLFPNYVLLLCKFINSISSCSLSATQENK